MRKLGDRIIIVIDNGANQEGDREERVKKEISQNQKVDPRAEGDQARAKS